ncbi:MAG: 16S rRNA (guanine(527)-N(7))-methyltransferase RsmG [Candidatus Cohnella colombiensis]|uniref:Ribosomal RNA small subunit methyltransferase G n=1 Tax=Candidatus Cohnella colombiensis TaxID=3121368 RepID=A0AA95EWH0_9BACL|nr:MAG: 16S rRNA (guanine(527)-N(7))-methyltransferase RsmG [Cohnella sp.]
MDHIEEQFTEMLASISITLSARQLEQFNLYFKLLVEWNEKMNLTGITERAAVYEKHFYDSMTLARAVDLREKTSLVDIGSGAGFPSIPIAIVYPHLKVTIIDSLAKRIRFLEEVTGQLGLSQVSCLHSRAEDAARLTEHRDQYDVATARAVARLAALNELCLPFVRTNGLFIAMKGSDIKEELIESEYSAGRLNAQLERVEKLQLPTEGADRHLIITKKFRPTPVTYPRKSGLPIKSPLVKPGK